MIDILGFLNETLKNNGYDGLVNPGHCGCELSNLSPGYCLCEMCKPAYKHTHSVTGEWMMSVDKRLHSDDEIQEIIDDI